MFGMARVRWNPRVHSELASKPHVILPVDQRHEQIEICALLLHPAKMMHLVNAERGRELPQDTGAASRSSTTISSRP